MRSKTLCLLLFVGIVLAQRDAHAYLDPASGAIILQVIAGGVVGALVIIKMYWARVKTALGLGGKKDCQDESEAAKVSEEE